MKAIIALLMCIVVAVTMQAQPQSSQNQEIVFRNVNVIPMDREVVLNNQNVVVKDGKIVALGDAGKIKFSKAAVVVDGTGKYLMPGLAEMHAHVPPIDDMEPMKPVLKLYLYNGITTIRGMLGHPRHIELREKINSGEVVGPHFYTTGPSFNGFSVKTPEAGAAMVREQKQLGYDFLKLHPGLTKDNFAAIAATAHEVGIPFAGHVSFGVGVWRAIEAGYSSIDHLDGFIESLVPGIDTMVEQQTGLFGIYVAHRADESRIPKLTKALKEKNIWVVPTQALAERWESPQAASVFLADPEMKYMDRKTLDAWEESKKNFMGNPSFSADNATHFIMLRRRLIKACQDAGVGLLLGSDAPQVFNVPGFSAHRELQYLVGCGLTPYQALRTGTANVGVYLNKPAQGVIKAGSDADVILLAANPLDNVSNTTRIEGVMIGTSWMPKVYLEAELKKLEQR